MTSSSSSAESYSSRISPTISSSRSSSVTRPAVPPYSSTTICKWTFLVRMLLDRALRLRDVQEADELFLCEVRGSGGAPGSDSARDDRDDPQDRAEEAGEPVDRARGRQRHALSIRDCKSLRGHLGGDE